MRCYTGSDIVTYETICEKLGFDLLSWEPDMKGEITEDCFESPTKDLTIEELEFVYKNGYMPRWFNRFKA